MALAKVMKVSLCTPPQTGGKRSNETRDERKAPKSRLAVCDLSLIRRCDLRRSLAGEASVLVAESTGDPLTAWPGHNPGYKRELRFKRQLGFTRQLHA